MSDIFENRLYRTPYLVIPRLALEAMPIEWQEKFEALMKEADEAGIKTPDYFVFRDLTAGNPDAIKGVSKVGEDWYKFTVGYRNDPWANYRHSDALELSK
jgi:hypothetical protein